MSPLLADMGFRHHSNMQRDEESSWLAGSIDWIWRPKFKPH
jgi:hypothetical protein